MNSNFNDLQYLLERITPSMTNERLDFLKRNTSISLLNVIRIYTMKKRGANEDLLKRYEYAVRYDDYVQSWYKAWKELNWGIDENESLVEFADRALDDSIREQKKKLERKKIK